MRGLLDHVVCCAAIMEFYRLLPHRSCTPGASCSEGVKTSLAETPRSVRFHAPWPSSRSTKNTPVALLVFVASGAAPATEARRGALCVWACTQQAHTASAAHASQSLAAAIWLVLLFPAHSTVSGEISAISCPVLTSPPCQAASAGCKRHACQTHAVVAIGVGWSGLYRLTIIRKVAR